MSKKSTYETADFRCPFYRDSQPDVIVCEGITDDSVIHMKFKGKAERNRQATIFCKGCYEKCELYIALMMYKYGE